MLSRAEKNVTPSALEIAREEKVVDQGLEAVGDARFSDALSVHAFGDDDPWLSQNPDRRVRCPAQAGQETLQESPDPPSARGVGQRVTVYQDDRHWSFTGRPTRAFGLE